MKTWNSTSIRKAIQSAVLLTAMSAATALADNPVPEIIDSGRTMAENGTHLYYAQDRDWDTDPCVTNPLAVVYGRLPHGGGPLDIEQLTTGCGAIRASAMVATDQHVYYVDQAPAEAPAIYRIPLGGGAPQLLHTAAQSVIAKDDSHIYFFAPGQIVRFALETPDQLQFLMSFDAPDQVTDLEVVEGFLYWTEADEDDDGAVRLIVASGGPVMTVKDSGVEGAWDLTYTDDHIFWSELGGRIFRRNQATGINEVIYEQDEPVYDLDVEGDTLVFTRGLDQGGTIWRMPQSGGEPTLMAFDQSSPREVRFSNGYVYWTTPGAVKRLPEDAQADGVDYVIDRMEVTQGIQDGAHSAPLGAGKLTFVRVYPREAVGPAQGAVRAVLHGFRDGVEMANSPIGPYSAPIDPDDAVVTRAQAWKNMVFALPDDWTVGHISLQAEINPVVNGDRRFENDYANNRFPEVAQQTVIFKPSGLCLVNVRVAAYDDALEDVLVYDNFGPQVALDLERAESVLAANIVNSPRDVELRKDNGDGFDLKDSHDLDEVLSLIHGQSSWGDRELECGPNRAVFMGMVHGDARSWNGGRVADGTPAGYTVMYPGNDSNSDYNLPLGGIRLAHEVSHAIGFDHVDCGVEGDGPFEDYPYAPCKLGGSNAEDDYWPFDGLTIKAMNPTGSNVSDYMSYGDSRWVSDYTWNKAFDILNDGASRSAAKAPVLVASKVLAVGGMVARDRVRNRLHRAYQLSAAQMTDTQREQFQRSLAAQSHQGPYVGPLPANGKPGSLRVDPSYVLEVLDSNDNVLYTQPVEYTSPHDAQGSAAAPFSAVIPWNPDTAALRLRDRARGGKPVVRRPGPATPGVSVIVDATGDGLAVMTTSLESDGDDVRYVYQYSADGGDHWQPLAVDTSDTLLQIDLAQLPGSEPGRQSQVRVFASDGINTATAVSLPFDVGRKTPTATIVSPLAGETVAYGTGVLLRGAGSDPERIDSDAGQQLFYSWSVDGEAVGQGRWVTVDDLTPGFHSIELRVMDTDQMIGSKTIRIEVQ